MLAAGGKHPSAVRIFGRISDYFLKYQMMPEGYSSQVMTLHVIITWLTFPEMMNFDRDLQIQLHDVARMLRTRFDRWARSYGLTRAQGVILVRLYRQPGLSQNEMAAICEVEPITVGRLVDRLEARGLIERRPDPTDRRIRRLHLLPASEPILARIEDYRADVNDYLLSGVSAEARETVVNVLLHMKHKLTLETAGEALVVGGE
jgi:MarR family transcriptional regulator for hemolysin